MTRPYGSSSTREPSICVVSTAQCHISRVSHRPRRPRPTSPRAYLPPAFVANSSQSHLLCPALLVTRGFPRSRGPVIPGTEGCLASGRARPRQLCWIMWRDLRVPCISDRRVKQKTCGRTWMTTRRQYYRYLPTRGPGEAVVPRITSIEIPSIPDRLEAPSLSPDTRRPTPHRTGMRRATALRLPTPPRPPHRWPTFSTMRILAQVLLELPLPAMELLRWVWDMTGTLRSLDLNIRALCRTRPIILLKLRMASVLRPRPIAQTMTCS